jgi:hypothetical protein
VDISLWMTRSFDDSPEDTPFERVKEILEAPDHFVGFNSTTPQ